MDSDAEEPDYFQRHYGLAVSIARRYALRSGRGESIDDLSQVALLGLVRAVDRFDAGRGVPFSAFASTTIAGELKHHLRDRTWTVRPPRRVQNLYLRSRQAVGALTHELGRSRPCRSSETGSARRPRTSSRSWRRAACASRRRSTPPA